MKKTLIARAIAATLIALPCAAMASEEELMKRIDQLAAELEKVKAELAASKQKATGTNATAAAPASTTAPAAPVVSAAPVNVAQAATPAPAANGGASDNAGPQTVLTGYGEINYNRPRKDPSQAQTDVRRAVIGIQHRFDPQTKLVSEFEWEHAVTSADDRGEAEVEQLYIEREFANGLRGKAGLFLIPAGLLNTNHEPTAYYGVERNFVETAIIPSTWREAGIGLSGDLANGLTWDTGITTGFDITKWDPASTEGRESPLGSIHQEGQLAKSRDLSVHGALNWRGVPGLLVGGSVFTGKAGHGTANFAGQDARITLWDLHGRYTPGRWDLSALYARGQISNIDALNLTFAGNPTPVPSSFYGWYAQAAYQALKSGDYTLSPFVRYERFNTAASYTSLPAGLSAATGPSEQVVTLGANLRIGEGVVLKADYQKFREDTSRDRLNLGAGFAF
jgi:hypothetical protein